MTKRRATDHGTPCATAWTREWVALVNQTEDELDRRICGAAGLDGMPCTLTSDHPNGRCRYHGGNHLIGAPQGNLNARVHGLYSRRLQTCDTRCLLWEECPFPAADIMDLPVKQRPNCVYEQLEYDTLIEHYTPTGGSDPLSTPVPEPRKLDPHLAHTTALLQVMMSRAAAVLSAQSFTQTTRASGDHYSMESSKVSAALDAFLRLAREHRHYRHELAHIFDHAPQTKPMGLADLMKPMLNQGEGVLEDALEFEQKRRKKLRDRKTSSHPGDPVSPIPADLQEPDRLEPDHEVREEGKQRVAALQRPRSEDDAPDDHAQGLEGTTSQPSRGPPT